MNLHLNNKLGDAYKSKPQKARKITEGWTAVNMYCPICGEPHIAQFEANRPSADFYCEKCGAQFEQKSLQKQCPRRLGKLNGSGYDATIERLRSDENPHLLLLYHKGGIVNNLILIPKHFFTTSIVVPRKPVKPKGRATPWTGCHILLENVPETGRIYIIKDGVVEDPKKVITLYRKTLPLKTFSLTSRGWLLDVLTCLDTIPSTDFTLADIYAFIPDLKKRYTGNTHIKDKIRQQLQVLRDKGFVKFSGRGKYQKI